MMFLNTETVSKDVQEFRLLTPFSIIVPYWTHFGECICNFSFTISSVPSRKRKSAEKSGGKKSQGNLSFFFPFLFNRYVLPRQDRRRVTLPVCVFTTSGNHNKPFLQCAVTRACTDFALHVTEMKINPDRIWEAEEETRTSLPP